MADPERFKALGFGLAKAPEGGDHRGGSKRQGGVELREVVGVERIRGTRRGERLPVRKSQIVVDEFERFAHGGQVFGLVRDRLLGPQVHRKGLLGQLSHGFAERGDLFGRHVRRGNHPEAPCFGDRRHEFGPRGLAHRSVQHGARGAEKRAEPAGTAASLIEVGHNGSAKN